MRLNVCPMGSLAFVYVRWTDVPDATLTTTTNVKFNVMRVDKIVDQNSIVKWIFEKGMFVVIPETLMLFIAVT